MGLCPAELGSKRTGRLRIDPPLGSVSCTLLVCDPCLFRASQQCSPYSSAEMLALLSVGPRPVGVAGDFLPRLKLLSAARRHAAPWYQVYVWTGGLASLLQVRVTGSLFCSSAAGETETAVLRGESGQDGDEKSVTPCFKSYGIL